MSQTAAAEAALPQTAPPPPLKADAGQHPQKPSDPLVAKVMDRIARLADGNPLPRKDIALVGSRVDRHLTATLRVMLDCKPASKTYAGTGHPEGSVHCRDQGAMAERLAALTGECLSVPGNAEEVAALIKKDPASAFAGLADVFPVGQRVIKCHRHAACEACGATGQVECSSCHGRGDTPCNCRNGKDTCRASGCRGGVEHYVENRWSPAIRGFQNIHLTRGCRTCNGSGYSGSCPRCSGTQRVTCLFAGDPGT